MNLAPYNEYRATDIHWLGDVPTHWDVRPLRTVLLQRNEKNSPVKTEQILSLSIAHGVTLYSHEGRGGNKRKADVTAYKIARVGDIVLNSMNVIVGAVGLSRYTGAISPVYYALFPATDEVDIRYYDKIFENPTFQRYLLIYGKGILIKKSNTGKLNTIRMKISPEDLKSTLLPIPPKEEQRQIARFLDWESSRINKFIRNKRRLIELLKEQKQNVINQAVTRGLDPNVKLKPSGVEWIGDIPAHWEVTKLKRVVRFSPSKSETGADKNDEAQVVFLPMERISVNGEVDCTERRSVSQAWDGFTYFRRGDVVLAKITPCFENGKGACLKDLETEFGFGTTELIVLRPSRVIDGEFLRFLTSTKQFLQVGEQFMTGAAGQQRIPSSFVKEYPIGLPPVNEQQEILGHIRNRSEEIDDAITRAEREIDLIREYRTRLVSDVVTGQVDVRGIEVPEVAKEELKPWNGTPEEAEELVEDEAAEVAQ